MDEQFDEQLFKIITFDSQLYLIVNKEFADQLTIFLQNLEEIHRKNWGEIAYGLSKAKVNNYYRSCLSDFSITEFNGVLSLALDPKTANSFSKFLNAVIPACKPDDLLVPNFFASFAERIEIALDDCPGIEDNYHEPEDCPTCGYPGCYNRCVCDICGVGPNAHADNCGELPAWMESEEDGSDEPDKRLDAGA